MENRCEEMREQVKAYHKEHPEIFRLFAMYTFEMIDSGKKITQSVLFGRESGGKKTQGLMAKPSLKSTTTTELFTLELLWKDIHCIKVFFAHENKNQKIKRQRI